MFGSLMVYVFPALIRTAIAEQTLSRLMVGASAATSPLLGGAPFARSPQGKHSYATPQASSPLAFGRILRAMFTERRHRLCAFVFTWGVSSGILSVAITAMKQLSEKG